MPDDIMQARLEALAANFAQTAAAQKDWSLSADVIADYEQRAADLRTLLDAVEAIQALARSDGNRTFDDCIRDLGKIDDLCREALK